MALKDRQLQNFQILVRKQFDIFRKEDVNQPNPGKKHNPSFPFR